MSIGTISLVDWQRCANQALWTSAGKIKREWKNAEYVLSFFGRKDRYRQNYLNYIRRGIDQGHRSELVGGGLNRSMGGWSAVLSSRKRGERNIADQRILGDSEFVAQIVSDLDDRIKKNLRLSGQRISIETLGDRVSEKFSISIGELKSGGLRKSVVDARRILSWIAVTELGYSGAEVARFLGVTNSCVTRIIAIGKKPDIDNIELE